MQVVGIVKLLVLALALLSGVSSCFSMSEDGEHPLRDAIPGAIVGIVAMPYVISVVIRLNIAVGYLTTPFKSPLWNDNPFNKKNPLPFIQFASACFGAFGFGAMMTTPWYGLLAVPGIIVGFASALGTFLGLRKVTSKYS